jgi:hypothetical protein
MQFIKCTGTTGSFRVGFRTDVSPLIPATADAATVKALLEQMPFALQGVVVTFGGGATTACSAGGTNIIITFSQNFGNLPAMRVVSTNTVTVVIYANGQGDGALNSFDGTRENAICSGRGICNYDTGVCQCFLGWASSDGAGNEGNRGDCGHLIPAFSPEKAAQLANDSPWLNDNGN